MNHQKKVQVHAACLHKSLCASLFLTALLSVFPLLLYAKATGFEIVDNTRGFPLLVDNQTKTIVGIPYAVLDGEPGGEARAASEDEQFLGRFDAALRKAGYAPPALGPRVIYPGTNAERYRLFLVDFAGGGYNGFNNVRYGVYMPNAGCGTTSQGDPNKSWIAINAGKVAARRSDRQRAITHELFHAYQFSEPLFQPGYCPENWILEALADAAANLMDEGSHPQSYRANSNNFSMAGLRSYRIAFQDEEAWISDDYFQTKYAPMLRRSGYKAMDSVTKTSTARTAVMYLTSGFWQFLARRSTGIRPDYASPAELSKLLASWLPLMQTSNSPGSGGMAWLRAVNTFVSNSLPLEKHGKVDVLYGWLPEFFTEFASWWRLRNPGFGKEKWMKHAFGGCERVELKPGRTASRSGKKITLTRLAKNSARCIDIRLSGFTNPFNLVVRADNFGSSDPDQFHLGLAHIQLPGGYSSFNCWNKAQAGDSRRIQCRRMGKAGDGAKTWKKEQINSRTLDSGEGSLDATLTYVFSNVAPHVDKSKEVETVDLTFTASYNFGGNKKLAPPDSVRTRNAAALSTQLAKDKRETFYRLYTSAAADPANMFKIELNRIDEGEQPICGGKGIDVQCAYATGGDYYIWPQQPVQFGQTGRIHASVHANPSPNRSKPLGSSWCGPDADQKAVEILDSSDEGVVIRVNTDLCEQPTNENNFCGGRPTCPVRDHLLTTLTLGLGREHFADTAPVHLLTPGTRFDMDLYYRDGTPLGSPAPFAGPGPAGGAGSGSGPSTATTPRGAAAAGPAFGVGGSLGNCKCSCEEYRSLTESGEAAKAAGDDEARNRVSQRMMACMGTCQQAYMICDYEEQKKREAELEAQAAQAKAPEPEGCDCSCAAVNAIETTIQSALERYQAGDQNAMAEMTRLGDCMSACQNQVIACRQK